MESKQRKTISAKMRKVGNELQFINERDKIVVRDWKAVLPDNAIVDVFFEEERNEATTPQIRKVHAMIGELASESGTTFENMKLLVKHKAGMTIKTVDGEGNSQIDVQSFGNCTKDQMSLAIEAASEIATFMGITLR